jgi:hydrogenase maturation protein HypF
MQLPREVDERRTIRVRGIVQGVGFRPTVYRLAHAHGVAGFVRNDREGVWIEIEGPRGSLDRFLADLPAAAPSAARIDRLEAVAAAPRGDEAFRIAASPDGGGERVIAVPADLAPCDDCLRELADPRDRRHRYPFINCTACGPRFTIVREVPYDRPATTMAAFTMCGACWREYDDPRDRRFHAQPIACPACGPQLRLLDRAGRRIAEGDAALRAAARAIAGGAIVALKGVGGFALAADASQGEVVRELRRRKRRPHKPFAVMGRSLAGLEGAVLLDDEARALLTSPGRPIVLAPARPGPSPVAPEIAPGLSDLGVFLPPSPLQHLLLADGPPLQLMTSGNLADEPIARTDEEALARLAAIADLFLTHDREVHARADDSVVRAGARGAHAIPIRRARGQVPDAIPLPVGSSATVLAVGAQERSAVCLAHAGQAVLSQHIGDLHHPEAARFFEEAIAHLVDLVGASPDAIACDLHPDYRSTAWARGSALPRIAIQHHHAHLAACLAENGRTGPVTGVVFDGTGLGGDGALWGGEILDGDLGAVRRAGHLRPLALAGGEMAIRQPWRLAAAALLDAGLALDLLPGNPALARVRALLATDLPPRATGAGRWFDAVAALLGAAPAATSYDGQAAAALEALAAPASAPPFELAITGGAPFEIDLRPAVVELARELARGAPRPHLAARFHTTLAVAVREACRRLPHRTVALSGGCFVNRRLAAETCALLAADGFEVLVHRRVPPGDGGLALGQAAIACHQLATRSHPCA